MYVWKILVLIVTATVAFIGVLVFWQFCRYKVYYGWLRPALSDKVSGSVYLSDRIRMDYMLYSNGVRLYEQEVYASLRGAVLRLHVEAQEL